MKKLSNSSGAFRLFRISSHYFGKCPKRAELKESAPYRTLIGSVLAPFAGFGFISDTPRRPDPPIPAGPGRVECRFFPVRLALQGENVDIFMSGFDFDFLRIARRFRYHDPAR